MRMARGALVALVAMGIAATPAQAGVDSDGGYKFVTENYKLKAGKAARLSATCPKGTHAYGGGQSNPGLYGSFAQLQTYPFDGGDKDKKPDDGFEALVRNTSSDKIKTSIYATCGKPRATYKAKKVPINGLGSSSEIDVSCPDGKPGRLVGGGVRGPKPIVHDDGGPTGDGNEEYYYAYLSNGDLDEQTAKVYAICAKLETTLIENAAQIASHTQLSVTATCPNNTVALDGGMGSTGGLVLNGSFASVLSHDVWIVFGDNTTSGDRTITSNTVCAARP